MGYCAPLVGSFLQTLRENASVVSCLIVEDGNYAVQHPGKAKTYEVN